MLVNFVIALMGFLVVAEGIETYCSMNNFETNSTHMQFTKEASFQEFAVAGKFKGLHCCAKGYQSIEWLKDGIPYPWPESTSKLILYPESKNQTIYTKTTSETDAGRYTCLLRNDSEVHSHTINLQVFEKASDEPQITYISEDKKVSVGENLRLFCEAFSVRIDLPDASNDAIWLKSRSNGTIEDNPRMKQISVTREEGQTYGTYLLIDSVHEDDFGEYICRISQPGKTIERKVYVLKQDKIEYFNPNPFPVKEALLFGGLILSFVIIASLILYWYGLRFQTWFKDSFGRLEEEDGKTSDALILYSNKDSEIVLGVLLPTLENKYNYKCASKELPQNMGLWYSGVQGAASKSRRILAVISPSTLNDNWDPNTVYQALKQFQSLGPPVICITLKPFQTIENEAKNSRGETLNSLINSLKVLSWERNKFEDFWLSLRLRLPPKRRDLGVTGSNLTQGENSSRLTSDSEEDLV